MILTKIIKPNKMESFSEISNLLNIYLIPVLTNEIINYLYPYAFEFNTIFIHTYHANFLKDGIMTFTLSSTKLKTMFVDDINGSVVENTSIIKLNTQNKDIFFKIKWDINIYRLLSLFISINCIYHPCDNFITFQTTKKNIKNITITLNLI